MLRLLHCCSTVGSRRGKSEEWTMEIGSRLKGMRCRKEEVGDVGLKVCAFVAQKLKMDI